MMVSYDRYALPILRWGLALVILWFGVTQILTPTLMTGFIPEWVSSFMDDRTAVVFNGIFEVILGATLLFGVYARLAALILALHMISVLVAVGYGPTGVRDFGIFVGLVALAFHSRDEFCLDHKWRS